MPGSMLTEGWRVARRILIVQSRGEVAAALRGAIEGAAVEAFVLFDGHGVMRAIERWAPDVVVVDLTLPVLDGWYVLAELGGLASPPFVVVRVGTADDVDRAIALGADAWVDDDAHILAAAGRLVPAIAA
jgi:DNA-binding response OmpR family regulator